MVRGGMRDRCASVITRGLSGLLALAILMPSAGPAFARDLEGNIKTCGKWVLRLEDDKKRRIKRFPEYLVIPGQPETETEVFVSFVFSPIFADRVAIALTNTKPIQFAFQPLDTIFTFGLFRQKGKKVTVARRRATCRPTPRSVGRRHC